MKTVIEARDWSEIKEESRKNFQLFYQPQEKESTEPPADPSGENRLLLPQDYFPNSQKKVSPFNLGIYYEQNSLFMSLRATQYVGVVPLIKINDQENVSENIIKVISRFDNLSPLKMLSYVLQGDDYYENPEILKTHAYSKREWLELAKNPKKKQKYVFGILDGFGKINLLEGNGGDQSASEQDIGLAGMVGAFEIIDFVNKAKAICKMNLKRQSCRVEENLNCKVKGRILVQKQFKYNVARGQIQKVYCAYNQMSPDIKENQILKYALYLCRKEGIGDSLAEDIQFCMNALKGVPLKKCTISDFRGLKNNGAYRLYKEALQSAKKVISRYSLEYDKTGFGGDGKPHAKISNFVVKPFYIDMNVLFEYYCRALFKTAIKSVDDGLFFSLRKPEQIHLLFEVDQEYLEKKYHTADEIDDEDDEDDENAMHNGSKTLRRFFMPTYKPDIVIEYDSTTGNEKDERKVAAVIDAKYSDVGRQSSKIRRERTQQVLLYLQALNCGVTGLIGMADNVSSDCWKLKEGKSLYYDTYLPSKSKKSDKKLCFIPLNGEALDRENMPADDPQNRYADNDHTSFEKIVKDFVTELKDVIDDRIEKAQKIKEIIMEYEDKITELKNQNDGNRCGIDKKIRNAEEIKKREIIIEFLKEGL